VPTSLGPAEILIVLVVALIVLGPKRLPEAGRQVGRALAELRRWSQGVQTEIRSVMDTEVADPPPMAPPPPAPPPPPLDSPVPDEDVPLAPPPAEPVPPLTEDAARPPAG
jgi:sec-independent protein translocase protein TatA